MLTTSEKHSALISVLRNKSLRCRDQKPRDQQSWKDDTGSPLSRLRREEQHDQRNESH